MAEERTDKQYDDAAKELVAEMERTIGRPLTELEGTLLSIGFWRGSRKALGYVKNPSA